MRRYFNRIKKIWNSISGERRVIPFCTPVIQRPTALVVGINHAGFASKPGPKCDAIADEFARSIPRVNTYLEHDHKFASGLREVASRAEIEIDATWVGTNRCAVQTDSLCLGKFQYVEGFSDCQRRMDKLLKELIVAIEPRNVILVGKFAAELFFANAKKLKFDQLIPAAEVLEGHKFMVIPVKHVSRGSMWDYSAKRLAVHFTPRPLN